MPFDEKLAGRVRRLLDSQRSVEEKRMSADYSGRVPKRGDHVGLTGPSGVFEVVDVNTLMQTVNIKSTDGTEHVTRNIPWTSLKFQGAARR